MSGPVADIAAFNTARLDEWETGAWAFHDVTKCDALLYEEDLPGAAARTPDCDCGVPARRRREVAALRAIVALHKPDGDPADEWYGHDVRCGECGGIGGSPAIGERGFQRSWPCRTVRNIAAIWADHPGYKQAWNDMKAGAQKETAPRP